MPLTATPWSRMLARRALLVGLAALAIGLSSLFSGGAQPLGLKPTAAATIGSNSALSVSEAISPTNGSVNVAARGPSNSLRFYWEVGGTWYGPLGLGGAGTTFSAPKIIAESDGNFDIAVEGPNHTTYFYWDASGTWYGPYGAGAAGTTYSTPSMVIDFDGNLNLVAEGPGNTLYAWWNVSGSWFGPLGIGGGGTTFSSPDLSSVACGSGCSSVFADAVGPNNNVRQWTRQIGSSWAGPTEFTNDGQAFSTTTSYITCCPSTYAVYEGVNHSLQQSEGFSDQVHVGTAGTAYSAPSLIAGSSQSDRLLVEGPSNSLYFWFEPQNGNNWAGPAQVGAPGTTFSAPSLAEDPSTPADADAVVQGPGNSLYFYWTLGGAWYGPLQVAGAGTTFSSSN
jgi:hypothetical protein